jgi:hypothetical protein
MREQYLTARIHHDCMPPQVLDLKLSLSEQTGSRIAYRKPIVKQFPARESRIAGRPDLPRSGIWAILEPSWDAMQETPAYPNDNDPDTC